MSLYWGRQPLRPLRAGAHERRRRRPRQRVARSDLAHAAAAESSAPSTASSRSQMRSRRRSARRARSRSMSVSARARGPSSRRGRRDARRTSTPLRRRRDEDAGQHARTSRVTRARASAPIAVVDTCDRLVDERVAVDAGVDRQEVEEELGVPGELAGERGEQRSRAASSSTLVRACSARLRTVARSTRQFAPQPARRPRGVAHRRGLGRP